MLRARPVRAVATSLAAAALWAGGPDRPHALSPAAGPPARSAASCHAPLPECVAELERTLASVRDGLGCDHRAPFPALYTVLQRTLRDTLVGRPGFFTEPSWVAGDINPAFVGRYLTAYEADRSGHFVPQPWRIAFDAARQGGTNAGQDALLGMSAHIQYDMPYALATSGLVRADGTSRKADYDRFQAVLDRTYGPAVRDIAVRYDPLLHLADDRWNPVAHLTGHELMVLWRQKAWHHARRLVAARTPGQTRAVTRAIETNAVTWAATLAAVRTPAYDSVRDAHCRRHSGGGVATAPAGRRGAPAHGPASPAG
ncbi:DUF5995 family protein [Streptomyces sp. NPDC053048]|uniref:DUF5995 family protein n=1 Tax=Streptomyces sp. NPDC053048 TaxID=3365694 RepID=UPI0037D527CA